MFNYSIYIKPLPSWQVFPEYSFTKHVPHYLAVGYEKQSHPSRTNMPGKSQVRKTSICMWSNKNKVTKWTKKGVCQVIQAVTFLSPNVGGHQQPLKGSRFHHPKKVTINCQVCVFLLIDFWTLQIMNSLIKTTREARTWSLTYNGLTVLFQRNVWEKDI